MDRFSARTAVAVQIVFQNVMPRAPDKDMMAARTACRLAFFVKYIAHIAVFDPGRKSDLARPLQRRRRRLGFIHQFKVRMEGGKMQWNVIAEILQNLIAKASRLVRFVILPRNHQISDLKPYIDFMLEPPQYV